MTAPAVRPTAAAEVLRRLDRAVDALVAAADQGADRQALDRAATSLAGARAELEPLTRPTR